MRSVKKGFTIAEGATRGSTIDVIAKLGFTLAEVLITLGIIGIVAEMTIPTVIKNFTSQQAVSVLKKTYSVLSQSYNMAVQDNGTPDNWNLTAMSSPDGAEDMINKLAPYLNISQNCGRNTGCMPDITYYYLNNTPWENINTDTRYAKVILADGTLLQAYSYGNCTTNQRGGTLALKSVCGGYSIDINGYKAPNKVGIDMFPFYLTKYGIVPRGTQQDTINTFDSRCKDISTGDGLSCTAWVLYSENMDYLKCNGLSWSGPLTCN